MKTRALPDNQTNAVNSSLKKCYISGEITGTEDYKERFAAAEKEVEALGMIPVNPVTLPHIHDHSWPAYMKEAIAAMMRCECIYLLKGWARSEGACVEFNLSQKLEFECYYQWLAGKSIECLFN